MFLQLLTKAVTFWGHRDAACGPAAATSSRLLCCFSASLVKSPGTLEDLRSQTLGRRAGVARVSLFYKVSASPAPSHQRRRPCQLSSTTAPALHPDGAARSHLRFCPLLRVERSPGLLISSPSSYFQADFIPPSAFSHFDSAKFVCRLN